MVLSLTYATVIRCGSANIKKSGISWKGWRERWIVLKSNFLLVYKNADEHQFIFRLSLALIKGIYVNDNSVDRPRCLQLTMRGGTQYFLQFGSDKECEGWYDDIYRMSPLAPVLVIAEELPDVEEIVDYYFDHASSPSDASSSLPSAIENTIDVRQPRPLSNLQISSTPNLLNLVDSRKDTANTMNAMDAFQMTDNDRSLLRKAISFLCSCMEPRLRRRSDPGGEKPFDLVEIRLRVLLRVMSKWTRQYDLQVDYDTILALSEALKDGYVLCQTLNAIGRSPLIRPNDRDNAVVTSAYQELFSSGDLTDITADSSIRVAKTILTLAKLTESEDRINTGESLTQFSKFALPSFATNDDFIASRIKKKILRYDAVRRDEHILKVYKNVVNLLRKEVGFQNQRLEDDLMQLIDFMASLDTISCLVESRQFRIRLLQFFSIFPVSDHGLLREALKKDEIEIVKLFRAVVFSDEYKQTVADLQGEDAQDCVDLMQEMLDRRSLKMDDHNTFYHDVQRLMIKLSERSDTIPTSLFIKGVCRQSSHACGGGTFADIYRATYMDQDVALKRIRVFQGDITGKRKAQRHFCREALLWQKLRHPFVLPFCGIDSESFPSYLCMVSPWMRHGTILNHLHEYGHVNVEQKLFEVAQGLAYLHSQRIVHGDLRGSNILVNDDWHACLADFGLAVFEDATAATPSQQAGSVRWMAPELHHPQAFELDHFRRTFASDVYSFACVCIELFTGKPPFAHIPHDPAVMLRVMAEERPERSTDPFGRIMPDRLWDIIQVCWSHNPLDRSSMTQVVELMMNANTDFRIEIIPDSPVEALDWDVSLHNPSGSTLVRRRKLGCRSAAVRRPFGVHIGHKTSRSS